MRVNFYLTEKNRFVLKSLVAAILLLVVSGLSAQTVFWSDNFDAPAGGSNNNNAGVGWGASVATPGGGSNGSFFGISNKWIIGAASSACSSGNKLYVNATGSGNSYLSDVTTDRMRATPNISTVGVTGITLKFAWRCDGVPGTDYGLVGLSNDGGTTWNWLTTEYSGANNCVNASITVPASYEGITNFKIAFRFISNATSCSTCDPPFNIDNIELTCTTCPTGCTASITSNVTTQPTCTNANNGAITIVATDPTPSVILTYTISNGTPQNNTTGIFTGLAPGIYTVSVSNGTCSVPGKSDTITNPAVVPAPTASNTGPYCTGGNLQLNATNVTNATYNWTGPNTFNSTQNPTKNNITLADSGTYTVIATVNGCNSAPATTRVIISPTLTPPTLSSNSPLCAGDTLKLTASNIGGAVYNWTGPNTFNNTQNPLKANVAFADSGDYSVIASVGACQSAPAVIHVSVKPIPTTPVASSNSPLCVGDTLKLNATTVPNATYSWTGVNSFTAAVQNPTKINIASGDAGAYNVVATVNGCKSAAGSVTVTVNAAPTTPTVSSNSPLCVGDTLKLTASLVNGATYTWTGPNSFTSLAQNPLLLNIALTDSGNYSVVASIGSCKSSASATHVSVVPPPATPVASSNSPVCEGSTLNLTADNIPGVNFTWTGPATYNQQNPVKANATSQDGGTYTVVASAGSCKSAPATVDVIVSPAPVLTGISSNSPVCNGASLNLSAPSIPGVSYVWNGPNAFSDTAQYPSRPNMAYTDSGDYVVIGQLGSCTSAPVTIHISVVETPAAPTLTTGTNTICSGDSTEVCAPDNFIAYKWSNGPVVNCTYARQAGGYWVTVTAANGCSVTSSRMNIGVHPVSSVSIVVQGDTLASFGAQSYQWRLNDTIIPGANQNTYIATRAGNYSVEITDQNGCKVVSSAVFVDPNSVGIEEVEAAAGFDIYPNPASGIFNIRYTGANNRNIQLSMYNVIGEKVKEERLGFSNGKVATLDISTLPKGIYTLQFMQNGNLSFTKKLVVQ